MMEDAARSDLDRTDRAILNHLAANGRLPISDLAPLVNQSAATCFRRVQRLVERGVILRFSAILDSAKVGRGALVLVGVNLDSLDKANILAFESAVRALDIVIDCYLVSGEYDYFLKIRVADIYRFNAIHSDYLVSLPGINRTRTFICLKEVIDRHEPALDF
ncbi:Lrp/AsnC family transcriptional regulator [Nguyenibacter vanlangensis]|uniref:Lrp/AsnC family transcriptional regulator n=2 Tax=Nguyenibacter vanlangensis TaxID=1216886 RepID=A0ABZ3D4T2_9PROT|nr:Lrp/AsnC family transcriptional regulator [Nguyenibacter vanlangensis]